MSAFNENDLRHSASLLYKLNSIDAKVSEEISGLEIGVRNLWAKKYMMDWNNTHADVATKGSDEYGEYIAVNESNIYGYIGNYASYNDILQGKVNFETGKQYCLKVKWRTPAVQSYGGLRLFFKYSDGTNGYESNSSIQCPMSTTQTIDTLMSEKGKTITGVCCTYGTLNNARIYEIQLVQATKQPNDWLVAPEDLIDYTDTSIANIEIGGTNLLLNSKSKLFRVWSMNTSPTISHDSNYCSVTANSNERLHLYIQIPQQGSAEYSTNILPSTYQWKNKKLCMSLEVMSPVDMEFWFAMVVRIKKEGSTSYTGIDGEYYKTPKYIKAHAGSWTQIYSIDDNFEYDLDGNIIYDGVSYSPSSVGMFFVLSSKSAASSGAEYKLRNLKLEFGNKPTAWTPAPEDFTDYTDTSIDNLEIGGTNIIYGTINPSTIVSNSVKSTTAYNGAEVIECQYSATGANIGTSTKYKDFTISSSNFGKLKNNQDYTLSFDIKGTVAHATADQKIVNHFYNTNQGSTGYLVAKLKTSWGYSSTAGDGLNYLPITTSWERISITFTTTSTVTNANVIPSIIICRIRETYTGIISIANIQLEEGNKATSWSPAPEDKQDKITGTNQSILYIGTDGVTSNTNLKYNASTTTLSTPKINITRTGDWTANELKPLTTQSVVVGGIGSGTNNLLFTRAAVQAGTGTTTAGTYTANTLYLNPQGGSVQVGGGALFTYNSTTGCL